MSSSITATVATLVAQAERQDAQITADLLAATRAALEQRERLNRALLHGLRNALHAGEIGLTAHGPPTLPLPPALTVSDDEPEPETQEAPVEAASAPPAAPPPEPARGPTPPAGRAQRPVQPPPPAAIVVPVVEAEEAVLGALPDPGPTVAIRVPVIRAAGTVEAARSAMSWPGAEAQRASLAHAVEDIVRRLEEVERHRVAGNMSQLRELRALKTTESRPGLAARIDEAVASLLVPVVAQTPPHEPPTPVEAAPEEAANAEEEAPAQDSPGEPERINVMDLCPV